MRPIVILENIRSAYNVGNVIRTADALGREVWLAGYSPSPLESIKVQKTSLGAENNVPMQRFDTPEEAISAAKDADCKIIAAEITDQAIDLATFSEQRSSDQRIAVVFGNEVDGVVEKSLASVAQVVYIPMLGSKESLNIGQSAAIFMWELRNT